MQNYGNTSGSLNKLHILIGHSMEPISERYVQEYTDCITCKIHDTHRLPHSPKNGVHPMCITICKPILNNMLKDTNFLADYTRPQLMVKYQKAGLKVSMDKNTMIQTIEIYLLQQELFPNKQGLTDVE